MKNQNANKKISSPESKEIPFAVLLSRQPKTSSRLKQTQANMSPSIYNSIKRLTKQTKAFSEIKPSLQDLTDMANQAHYHMKLMADVYLNAWTDRITHSEFTGQSVIKEMQRIETQKEFSPFFEDSGWIEELVSLKVFVQLYFEWKNDPTAFGYLEWFNTSIKNYRNEIFTETLESKIFRRRKEYIRNILKLHIIENYISSIPLALIQIEGVVRDLGVLKKCLKNKENPKGDLMKVLKTLFGEKKKLVKIEVKEPLTKEIGEEIYTKDIRHSILHGNNLDYEDPILSAHLIAVLVTLSCKAQKIESESKIVPYWEKTV